MIIYLIQNYFSNISIASFFIFAIIHFPIAASAEAVDQEIPKVKETHIGLKKSVYTNKSAIFYHWQRRSIVNLKPEQSELQFRWENTTSTAKIEEFFDDEPAESKGHNLEYEIMSNSYIADELLLHLSLSHGRNILTTTKENEDLLDVKTNSQLAYGLGYNLAGHTGITFKIIHNIEHAEIELDGAREKYFSPLLGIGLDIAWLPQIMNGRWHILFSYLSPQKGSTLILSESRLHSKPGNIKYTAKYSVNEKISAALLYDYYLHKRDELTETIQIGNNEYLLRGSDLSQIQFDSYSLGIGCLYGINGQLAISTKLAFTEGNIILNTEKIPSSDKTNDAYVYFTTAFGISYSTAKSSIDVKQKNFIDTLTAGLDWEITRLNHRSQNSDGNLSYKNYQFAKNSLSLKIASSI